MQQESAAQYITYSEYKNIQGVEVQWPMEMPEEIAEEIIRFVKHNMHASEINSNVILIFLKKSFVNY
jgi:hypothetical protein